MWASSRSTSKGTIAPRGVRCISSSVYILSMKVKMLVAQMCPAAPWTITHQAPLSMEFSRQEHCSGKTFLSSGDLPTQGSNPGLLHCRWILYQEPPGKPLISKVILQLQETNQTVECVERDSIQISLQVGLLYSFGKIVQQTTSSFQYCQRLPQWLKATIPNNILFLD